MALRGSLAKLAEQVRQLRPAPVAALPALPQSPQGWRALPFEELLLLYRASYAGFEDLRHLPVTVLLELHRATLHDHPAPTYDLADRQEFERLRQLPDEELIELHRTTLGLG